MVPSDLPILDELGREFSQAARRVESSPRSPQRHAPRKRLLLLAAAVLLATGIGAGALGGGDDGPSLADRAYAAVAPPTDAIRHVVAEATSRRSDGPDVRQRDELWISPDGCRVRFRFERPPGQLAGEVTQDQTETRTYLPDEGRVLVTPSGESLLPGDPVAEFRELYRRGKIRETGRTRLDGREVILLTMTDSDLTATYFFDAETFMPREMRLSIDGRPSYRYRILVYETLPTQAADQVLTMPDRPGVEVERRDAVAEAPATRRQQQCVPDE